MFNKKNIIKHAITPNGLNIVPAKSVVPDWYKNGKRFLTTDNVKEIKTIPVVQGFKLCVPFLDSLTAGYVIPLSQDIAVQQTEGGPSITFNSLVGNPVAIRDSEVNKTLPTPLGTSNLHFVWNTQVYFKVPSGYSMLATHPFNRFDLPFITTTGIIDGEYSVSPGSIPFYISSTFEGIIPAGTPIVQLLPFKTENWSSENDENVIKQGDINNNRSLASTYGWYRKNIWNKKSYE